MWSYVLASAILMLLWGGASPHLLLRVAGGFSPAVLSAWLAVALGAGGAVLLALAWLVLPNSCLSRGWTRDMLWNTQQLTALLVMAAGVIGFTRGRGRFLPASVDALQRAKSRQ